MFDILEGKVLLLHHWDTDGLCSAAMLLQRLIGKDIKTWTPIIGTFSLTNEHIKWIKNFDYVIVVDMALPQRNIQSIADNATVTIIDHHHQKPIIGVNHQNPVAMGAPSENFPATTWVIKELLDEDVSLFSILGAVGDREKKIKHNIKLWPIIQKYSEAHGISFDELLQMVYSIDANYKVGDKAAVEEAPHILKECLEPSDILENKSWNNKKKQLDEKIQSILDETPLNVKGVLVKRLDTNYAIISTITRRIAWNTGKNTLVVNNGFFPKHDQLYCRSNTRSMLHLIERAKELGFNAGGKKDVLGAIISKDKTESFIEEVINFLSSD
jgi:single-stranded DNA-specific DHH superfamily exonuclease